ncbi:hypothetical protein JXA88_18865 [Candidatus Fermentibacteria bacterium]|nr:hypothetical protein [Candidatus Fermentibacteria bacterium]
MVIDIVVFWVGLFALLLLGVVIHMCIVVPTLRRHGRGRLTGLINIRHYAELADYRSTCEAEGRPLTWWRVMVALHVAVIVGLIGWLLLLCR